jgi:hypothetical protein
VIEFLKSRACTGFVLGLNLSSFIDNMGEGRVGWSVACGVAVLFGLYSLLTTTPEDDCRVCKGKMARCRGCGINTKTTMYIKRASYCPSCALYALENLDANT